MKKFCLFLILLFSFKTFAEEPDWSGVKFPQWSRDLRRTEIIAFGSLPFVTMWTALGYSLASYGEFRNPLDRSAGSFTEEDQKRVVALSAGICVALGITDLVITLVSRSRQKSDKNKKKEMIFAEPLKKAEETERIKEITREYFTGGVQSAVF